MKTLSLIQRHRLYRFFRPCRMLCSLFACTMVACCLCVSCKGGGGGGAVSGTTGDPTEGEGTLTTTPPQEQLGMAPSYLIPEGYSCTQLVINNEKTQLMMELRAAEPKAIEGTVTGSLNLSNGEPEGNWLLEGRWRHQGVNTKDIIQEFMAECWDAEDENSNMSFNFNKVNMTVNARSETTESILLQGSITSGTLTAYKGSNNYQHDLTGSSVTLTIKR